MRPRPDITPLTQPFWDGAAQGRLVLQRCRACGHYDHPPFPECTQCRSADSAFEPVSGAGTIFQRCIVASPVVAGFEERIPYACLAVELDEQRGLLVVGNLVDNAVDAAGSPGTVLVSLRVAGGAVRLQVADSGPGVPPERVAEIFHRGYSTKPADASGRGVGLALVQVVCERRRGSVAVSSAPAGGAVFTAVLPLEPA